MRDARARVAILEAAAKCNETARRSAATLPFPAPPGATP